MKRKGRRGLWCAIACGLASLPALSLADGSQTAGSLDFDRTFAAAVDRGQSYYAATYRLEGSPHRVEVWRDREVRVKRRTDDAIETYLVRPAGDIEWSMTVLDLKRRIRTDIGRTNLLRIGHFTDWFAEAHALSRPKGAYRLTALERGPSDAQPIAACRWYRLTQGERSTTLCWSASAHVPLVIMAPDETVAWRVTKLGAGPFPGNLFAIDDRGYVRNDANADIQAD